MQKRDTKIKTKRVLVTLPHFGNMITGCTTNINQKPAMIITTNDY